MTVEELLAQLNDLPVDALKKNIFVESADGDTFSDMIVEAITESCDDFTIVGYVITQDRQMELPFNTYTETGK